MEKIKIVVKGLLERNNYSPIMVKVLNLVLDDKMNSLALKQCLSENGSSINTIKSEAISVILDYSKTILEDDLLTEDEIRIITLLKLFLQIKEGDFYSFGDKAIVNEILTTQLEKMYSDSFIDKDEALMKTDLQGLFCLSYDQFLVIVNNVAKKMIDKGARLENLDTFIK